MAEAEVASFLSKSDVMWVAFTALLTFGSVYLTNWHAGNQQRRALTHDAEQRDIERKMSLRRDVYLPAADAILNSQTLLARFLDPAISEQEIAPLLSKELTVINKTLIVGSTKTIQAAQAILHELNFTFLDLAFKRLNLKNRLHLINSIEKSNENEAKIKELLEIQAKEHFDFIELGIASLEKLTALIPPAFFAVREEMELPLDREVFLKTHKENYEKLKSAMVAQINVFRDL